MQQFIGLKQARELVADHTPLLPPTTLPLSRLSGRVAAAEVKAMVASPSVTASMKDGFAVRAADLAPASPDTPVVLEVLGMVSAGETTSREVGPGQALKIMTGAPLPVGADAVIPSEFTREDGGKVICRDRTQTGRNLLARGSDVAPEQVMAQKGQRLMPARVGLMAAAGLAQASVYPRPKVALLATGREVVAPGQPLPQGALYASNLVAIAAWLELHELPSESRVADDSLEDIAAAAEDMLSSCDALITSGGAWNSERDLVVKSLQSLGMELVFHRVRLGPGKGVAFGLLAGKPVFCLPGGPPSCEAAFLQLALPGLLRMAGHTRPGFPLVAAKLSDTVEGQEDWSQVKAGVFEPGSDVPLFRPIHLKSRLQSMADSQGIFLLPEGETRAEAGQIVMVQVLEQAFGED
jgi:molybdopterin molybdotransferase